MDLILYVVLFAVLLVVAIAAIVLIGGMRTRGQAERALNMTLFLIRVPREIPGKDTAQGREKELIAIGEQMLSGFSSMHAKGWNKFIYGEPYVALEMAVHHIG